MSPFTKTPSLGIIKFKILVNPFLVIITIYSVCLTYAQEWRRFLKKYINLTLFTPKLSSLGNGLMKYTISCLLTQQMLHSKLGKDWLSSS